MRFESLTKGIIYALAITAGVVCFTEVTKAKLIIDTSSIDATHPILADIRSHWGIATAMLVGCGGIKLIKKEENNNEQESNNQKEKSNKRKRGKNEI